MAKSIKSDLILLDNNVEVRVGAVNPSIAPGVAAPIGSLYLRTSTPAELWQKVGPLDTDWFQRQGASSFFGPGVDGDVTIAAGTTTLTRDMNYNNLTVQNGGILVTGGYRVFCKNQITVEAGGTIRHNGANAAGTAGGAGAAVGSIGRTALNGAPGGVSAANATLVPFNMTVGQGVGGRGGAGSTGAGGTGGTQTASTAQRGSPWWSHMLVTTWLPNTLATNEGMQGGSGGGGGGRGDGTLIGGGGGGGGGVMVLAGRIIVNNGTIQAVGGNGGPGTNVNAGGGGGGGGGKLFVFTVSYTGTAPSVAGGTGGAGNGTGANGDPGVAGFTITMEP